MTYHTKVEEIDMMTNPDKWPVFPLLPLKRRVGPTDMEFGTLACGILKGPNTDPTVIADPVFSQGVPPKTYESFEALYDDGWRVD